MAIYSMQFAKAGKILRVKSSFSQTSPAVPYTET